MDIGNMKSGREIELGFYFITRPSSFLTTHLFKDFFVSSFFFLGSEVHIAHIPSACVSVLQRQKKAL